MSRLALTSSLAALFIACCTLFPGIVVSQIPSQPGTASKAKNKTVVDMSPAELLQFYSRELSDLEFDLSQDELDYLLGKVAERVGGFFKEFTNTCSKEKVFLQRIGYNGRIEDSTGRDFYYLMLSHPGEVGTLLEENRTDNKGRSISQSAVSGFILTSGYACLSLYFHPSHQAGSRYRYLGRETKEPRAHVIAFAQRPEVGDYLAGHTDIGSGKLTRFLVQGIAWVDPHSYQILRMRTNLLAPENQISLREQTTDIRFSEVHFERVQQLLWLPSEVIVTWEFADRTFRNLHRYSDYRLFAVRSDIKFGQPQITR